MKHLTKAELKGIMGGRYPACTASASCANGHTLTCAGNMDGSTGCNGQDGVGVGCYYYENNHWTYAIASCSGAINWTPVP